MALAPESKAKAERIAAKKKELDTWLRTHPPQVAAVIAVRVGLRVLPFVVPETVGGALTMKERHRIVTAFRYLALARLSVAGPSYALYETCTVINSVAPKSGNAAEAAITEASFSATALSNTSDGRFRAEDVFFRTTHAVAIATAIDGAGLPWDEIARDRDYIDAGHNWFALLNERLWLDRDRVDNALEPHRACRALDGDDPSWKIWTDWYQDRLAGVPAQSDKIEYFRLTLIPNGHVKARDTSKEGRLLWKKEIEEKLKLFRSDARKANRFMQTFLREIGSGQNSFDTDPHIPATSAPEPPSHTPGETRAWWVGGFLRKYFGKDDN